MEGARVLWLDKLNDAIMENYLFDNSSVYTDGMLFDEVTGLPNDLYRKGMARKKWIQKMIRKKKRSLQKRPIGEHDEVSSPSLVVRDPKNDSVVGTWLEDTQPSSYTNRGLNVKAQLGDRIVEDTQPLSYSNRELNVKAQLSSQMEPEPLQSGTNRVVLDEDDHGLSPLIGVTNAVASSSRQRRGWEFCALAEFGDTYRCSNPGDCTRCGTAETEDDVPVGAEIEELVVAAEMLYPEDWIPGYYVTAICPECDEPLFDCSC
jgi:hypothetical protein